MPYFLHETNSQKLKKNFGGQRLKRSTGIVFGIPMCILLGTGLGLDFMAVAYLETISWFLSRGIFYWFNVESIGRLHSAFWYFLYQLISSGNRHCYSNTKLIELRLPWFGKCRTLVSNCLFTVTFTWHSSWFPSQATTAGILIQIQSTGLFTHIEPRSGLFLEKT